MTEQCNHPNPDYLAGESSASAGKIHWCSNCGAIRVVSQWDRQSVGWQKPKNSGE